MPLSKNHKVYIGLGANIGDCRANLEQAAVLLKKNFLPTKFELSPIYRSEPVDLTDQPWFYNQVAYMELSPKWIASTILWTLKNIENEMGRVKTQRYGPRCIDLDLLLLNDWVTESNFLTIPHAKILKRSFVLKPLIDLNPNLHDPRTGLKLTEVLENSGDSLGVCELLTDED